MSNNENTVMDASPTPSDTNSVIEQADVSSPISTADDLSRMLGTSMGMHDDTTKTPDASPAPAKRANRLVDRRKTSFMSQTPDGTTAKISTETDSPINRTKPTDGPGPSHSFRSVHVPQPPVVPRQINNARATTVQSFVGGRNIGSNASEPIWTDKDREEIENATKFTISTVIMTETRRSVADPKSEFVRKTPDGTFICTAKSMLPNAALGSYMLGLGMPKSDQKLDKRSLYSDVVMVGAHKDWVLSQWTSKDVVMEGVPESLLSRPPRTNRGQVERRIGHHFARFGFPKKSFGPVFETLARSIPGILSKITVTEGYYWTNASWGVTGSSGTFVHMDDSRRKVEMQDLSAAMRMIMDSSSVGVGTFAISTSVRYKIQNEQNIPIEDSYELSIKCHNMFHMKKANYHGPPQSASTGFELGDDLLSMAEPLNKPAAMSQFFSSSADMFGANPANPFGSLGLTGNSAASTKKDTATSDPNIWM